MELTFTIFVLDKGEMSRSSVSIALKGSPHGVLKCYEPACKWFGEKTIR